MGELKISPNNFLALTEPLKATAKDIAEMPPSGQTASRQYVKTTDNSASITIETTEGDKVTLD